jgi:hypothetical protein
MTKPDLGEELCCCVALGKYWCDVHNPSPTPQGECDCGVGNSSTVDHAAWCATNHPFTTPQGEIAVPSRAKLGCGQGEDQKARDVRRRARTALQEQG